MYANPGPPVADQRHGVQATTLTDGEIATTVAQGQPYQSFHVGDSDGKVQLRVQGVGVAPDRTATFDTREWSLRPEKPTSAPMGNMAAGLAGKAMKSLFP